jgi:site-specific DNA-cytosine methylase/intein/homing endonuclease
VKRYTALTIPSIRKINKLPKALVGASLFAGGGGASTGMKLAGIDVRYANEFIPGAIATYRANASKSTFVDERDIRTVQPSEILKHCRVAKGELDYLDASPPCFPAGTLVRTNTGLKPIQLVECGDLVLTHKARFRRVNNTMSRLYAGDMVKIACVGTQDTSSTPEHPFFVKKRLSPTALADPAWIEAKDVCKGDYVGIVVDKKAEVPAYDGYVERSGFDRVTRQFTTATTINTLPLSNPNFWYLIGRWLGDGWLRYTEDYASKFINQELKRRKNRYGFIICCKDPSLDGGIELKQITKRFDALGWNYGVKRYGSVVRVVLKGQGAGAQSAASGITSPKELVLWCLRFGRGAANKRLTGDILNLPIPLLKEVVRGYLAADGRKRGKGIWGFRGTSNQLIQGIAFAVAKIRKVPTNRVARVRPTRRPSVIEGRVVSSNPQWYTVTCPKISRMKAFEYDSKSRILWVRVRAVSSSPVATTVYNISVGGDDTYTANTLAVHNCKMYSGAAKFSRVGKRADAPVLYSENVKQRVDDLFDEFLRILKGVRPKVFATENVTGLAEGVSKGFFLEILQKMKDCGYAVEARMVDASKLGVPQRRIRIVFVGVRTDVSKAVCGPVFPKPGKKVLALRDVIPDAAFVQEGARGWGDARRPAPTIVAGGHSFNEYSQLSAGGYYKDDSGDVIKFTIPQLIKIFGYPEDYVLTGDFKMQWERLGRSHVPLAVYAIASTIKDEVLDPYNRMKRKKK